MRRVIPSRRSSRAARRGRRLDGGGRSRGRRGARRASRRLARLGRGRRRSTPHRLRARGAALSGGLRLRLRRCARGGKRRGGGRRGARRLRQRGRPCRGREHRLDASLCPLRRPLGRGRREDRDEGGGDEAEREDGAADERGDDLLSLASREHGALRGDDRPPRRCGRGSPCDRHRTCRAERLGRGRASRRCRLVDDDARHGARDEVPSSRRRWSHPEADRSLRRGKRRKVPGRPPVLLHSHAPARSRSHATRPMRVLPMERGTSTARCGSNGVHRLARRREDLVRRRRDRYVFSAVPTTGAEGSALSQR